MKREWEISVHSPTDTPLSHTSQTGTNMIIIEVELSMSRRDLALSETQIDLRCQTLSTTVCVVQHWFLHMSNNVTWGPPVWVSCPSNLKRDTSRDTQGHRPGAGRSRSSTRGWSVKVIDQGLVGQGHWPGAGRSRSSTRGWSVKVIDQGLIGQGHRPGDGRSRSSTRG